MSEAERAKGLNGLFALAHFQCLYFFRLLVYKLHKKFSIKFPLDLSHKFRYVSPHEH